MASELPSGDEALVDRFPALYSHYTRPKLSVRQVWEAGVDNPDFLVVVSHSRRLPQSFRESGTLRPLAGFMR